MTTPRFRLIDKRSVGTFNPEAWLDEGDGLLASAKVNRTLWQRRRHSFSQAINKRTKHKHDRARRWNELVGLPRASMLLLGYAVEMYLKAGLAKAYRGCREEMFDRDVRSEFGHRLAKIAKEIHFPFELGDEDDLNLLNKMIQVKARYPVKVKDPSTYIDIVNQRTGQIWNGDSFKRLLNLAERARSHSARIDRDKRNPGEFKAVRVDQDGYVALRLGGHLPPRITYRLSSHQKKNGDNSLKNMIALFDDCAEFHRINGYWTKAEIYEDGNKETKRRVIRQRA